MVKTIFEGKQVLVLEHDGWEFVERTKAKEAVVVIATTEAGAVILTEQFRRPVEARVIDFPAGLVGDEEDHEDAEETALRELQEETGYSCDNIELITSGPTSPGITSEIVSLYRAHGVTRTGKGGGVGGEDITVHEVPVADAPRWLAAKMAAGYSMDPKLWAGLWLLDRDPDGSPA